MSRTYSSIASFEAIELLNKLVLKETLGDPNRYRNIMRKLGELLGNSISLDLKGKAIYLVCTVEDADFLSMGIIESLSKITDKDLIRIACFWNERKKRGKKLSISVAPIIREYIEPQPSQGIDYVIVTKSIISGGCVVHTNLSEIIDKMEPECIYIIAPVIFEGAEASLNHLFPKRITNKFKFIYFAKDSERDNKGIIRPGIGGIVYDLLGFTGQEGKNRYRPELVKIRQSTLFL